MPREYNIPSPEGPIPGESSRLRIFQPDEMPVEIGSLERKDLSYLGDWKVFMDKQGYGGAHRLGTKEGLIDDEGDPTTLVLHFTNPVARRGLVIPSDFAKQQSETLKKAIQLFTIQTQQLYGGNILSINLAPPRWMMSELEEILR